MLSNVRVVLLNTSHPGNIGAVARAMKTMGLESLWLVNPKRFPDAEATARASGADDVLAGAQRCTTLDEALEECRLVIGASARSRTIPCPILNPHACAQRVINESGQGKVALLFGNEQSGLGNLEIDRCHYLVQIATNPEYGSLNLAAAVQVIAYEVYAGVAAQTILTPDEPPQHVPVNAGEMERFYEHLYRTLIALDFLKPENPRQLMRRLRRLFNRARPDQNEVNILRGILSAAQHKRD